MNLSATALSCSLPALLLLATGCSGDGHAFDKPIDPMKATAVDDHVVFVDRGSSRALLLDVSGTTAPHAPTAVPVVENPILAVPRQGHTDELLVLSAGNRDDDEDPGLVVVTATGQRREYRYSSAFTDLAQSDDGRFALLYFDQSKTLPSDSVFHTSNEAAIVDLSKDDPIVPHWFRSGTSPRSIAFTKMTIRGEERELAVALFASDVAILDLSHLDRPEYTVGLSHAAGGGIQLAQAVFSTEDRKIYLRATGSNDVYVITLNDALGGEAKAASSGDAGSRPLNDFTPSVNQLAAGIAPSDMAIYEETDETTQVATKRLLVVAPGSQEAVVIEPNSSNVTRLPLPLPASNVVLFHQPKPGDSNAAERALLYSAGTTALTFVDLHKVESRGALNLYEQSAHEPYASALSLDENTVMLIHQGTGLSELNLAERTVTDIDGPNLLSATPDPANKKLWVAAENTVAFLDLCTGSCSGGAQPDQVDLDAKVQDLITVPSPVKRAPRVVVTHESSLGWATVLDATDPKKGTKPYSMRGFFVSGVLGGGS